MAEKKLQAKKKPVNSKATPKAPVRKKRVAVGKETKKDIAESYNQYKIFKGTQYTGVKIGRGHKWYYDKGVWRDKKLTPDMWEINYSVTKRRAGKAPEGSGAPVGTEYHWYILAHQMVKKLNADDYSTVMTGLKFKLAHKRFDKENWSASERAQKKKLIKLFQNMIDQLQGELDEPVNKEAEAKEIKTQVKEIKERASKVVARKKASETRK